MLRDRQTKGRNYTNFKRNLAMMVISHSLAMLGRSARLVLLMSGILSDSEDI